MAPPGFQLHTHVVPSGAVSPGPQLTHLLEVESHTVLEAEQVQPVSSGFGEDPVPQVTQDVPVS